MTDEQISKLTITEIRELITRLLEEIELRFIAGNHSKREL